MSWGEVTLPELDDVPAHGGEAFAHLLVTLLIASDLGLPKVGTGLGHHEEVTRLTIGSGMSMPEAAIDQDDGAETTQHNVGCARQTLDVQAEAIAMGIEEAPHQ